MSNASLRKFAVFSFVLLAFFACATLAKTTMKVPAVDANGEGILTNVTVNVQMGSGEEYVSIVPFFSVETQQSSKSAIAAATSLAHVDRKKYDYFIKIVANAEMVDGPSGGAALALLTYSELTGKKMRPDISVTGSISPDGLVGKVGGVFKKAEAAAKLGVRLFVVPADQAVQDGVDLTTFAPSKWGLQVVEANRLEDVIKVAFTPEGSLVSAPAINKSPLYLDRLNGTPGVIPLKQLARQKIDEAMQKLSVIKATQGSNVTIKSSQTMLNESQYSFDQGYYYSAANAAFLVLVSMRTQELANKTKAELLIMASNLETKAKNTNITPATRSNMEWSFAAQLRKYWALQRLAEAKGEAGNGAASASLAQAIAAAEQWLDSVNTFSAIAATRVSQNSDELPIDEAMLRQIAASRISEAGNLSAVSPEGEAEFHLSTAKKAFAEGAYLAALVDATFARSFAKALSDNGDLTSEEAQTLIADASNYSDFNSVWAQLYFAHALYSRGQWRQSSDSTALLNALKLQELSVELEKLLQVEIPRKLYGETAPGTTPQVNPSQGIGTPTEQQNGGRLDVAVVQIEPKQNQADSRFYVFAAIAVLLLAIGAVIFIVGRNKPYGAGATPHEAKRRLDNLDDLLAEGRISEHNYERLRQKYSPIAQQAGIAQQNKRQAKPAVIVQKQSNRKSAQTTSKRQRYEGGLKRRR